jgi:hypothetical protein
MRNKKGDIGSPCLRPLSILNYFVGLPLMSTEIIVFLIHSRIQSIHFEGKFIFLITNSRKSQSTESYAFSKSTFKRQRLFSIFSPRRSFHLQLERHLEFVYLEQTRIALQKLLYA